MGTILKFLFYIVLVVLIYLVARDIMGGKITEKTTIGEALSDVDTGIDEIIDDKLTKMNSEIDDEDLEKATHSESKKP